MHFGGWAINLAGLVITEVTAVSPEGRITAGDAGLWNDEQVAAWQPITELSRFQGLSICVELPHDG